jgi:hypothetical protein
MEIALSHIAQTKLSPPLYFPVGSRICGIEITFSGGEWQVLYHAITAATFTEVHDFYKRRYDTVSTKWVPVHRPKGKPARFYFLAWKDQRRSLPLFSVLVMEYNEFTEDAKQLNLTRKEQQMTQIVAGVTVPDFCRAAQGGKSVSWMLPVPAAR